MSNLYFFSLRDIREEGVSKYAGLIPKLFTEVNEPPTLKLDDYGEEIRQKSLFKKILLNGINLLNESEYINRSDISKIIDLNLELFVEESMNPDEFKEFVEHLFKGHSTMEYGLYFGSRKADSDKEFLDSINKTNPGDPNQTLLFYTDADNLLKYVDKIKDKYKLKSPLLYFNNTWSYGKRNKDSIVYTGNNLYDFICHIRNYSNKELELSEVICHIPLPVELFNHTYRNLYNYDTFKGQKKKTKKKLYKPKKEKTTKKKQAANKKEKEATKYITILNHALKHIYSDKELEVFTKEDNLLYTSGFITNGFKKGFKYLKDNNTILDAYCNSMCMVVSIINYGLINTPINKMNIMEKLFLFFLSYLQKEEEIEGTSKKLPFKYSLKKAEMIIINEQKKYEAALRNNGPEHRRTKQFMKNINRLKKKRDLLIEKQGETNLINKYPELKRFYRLDKCQNIDCEYINSYHMDKSEKHKRVYEKFCKYIPELFKGMLWLNMYHYFGKVKKSKPELYQIKDELKLNFNIRSSMAGPLKGKLILIPAPSMYNNKSIYTDSEIKKFLDKDGKIVNYWVYTNLNTKKKTIQKMDIRHLPNIHFIAPILWDDRDEGDIDIYEALDNLIKGKKPYPVLISIYKTKTNFNGIQSFDLSEDIKDSITLHWVVVHKSKLKDHITDMHKNHNFY